jgi:hypothetical protein
VAAVPERSRHRGWVEFSGLGLVFLLLWWNTNPLLGGQIETVLAFLFLGSIAAVARLESHGGELAVDRRRSAAQEHRWLRAASDSMA